MDIAKSFVPDLIILDIMMPKQDGVETCRQIREIPELANAFVIFLTARSEEYSAKVAAFDMGADDYITKPIKPRALVSKNQCPVQEGIQEEKESNQISIDNLIVDRTSYTVFVGEEKVSLPKKEFELLYFLAQNPGKVFSRDELLQNIWGTDVYCTGPNSGRAHSEGA